MMEIERIMFAGGGTGGHVFPGLAVAEQLKTMAPRCRISFCGTGREWERSVVTRNGLEYCDVRAAPLVATPLGLLRGLYSNGVGYRAACRWVRVTRPNVVVGLGGYASLPLCLAAVRQSIPLMLLEQNLIPGRANRLLARWSALICTMFADSAAFLSKRAAIANTGNPVRRSIIERAAERADEANESRDADPVLLVLGGSQGAHGINQFVVENLPQLASNLPGWEVIHQTGDRDERVVREAYESRQIRCTVSRFIDDIAQVYARTTLAIARAGATTLAELAVAGIPAVLIPYPYAASNHQWHNAQAFGRAGAALVVEQRLGVAGPVSAVIPLLRVPELRREMRLSMLRLGRPDAARAIASQILRLARSSQPLQKLA